MSETMPIEKEVQSKYYTDCDLPILSFIHASVKDDLSVLVIDGHPSNEELQAAWLNINSEYRAEVNGGNDSYEDDLSRANYLAGKMLSVHLLVQALEDTGDEDYAALLKEHYPFLSFDLDDPDSLIADLEAAKVEIMVEENELAELQAKMRLEQARSSGQAIMTAGMFDDSLLAINRNEKMTYRMQDLTTRQFAKLLNALHKAAQKATHGNGTV